MAYTEQITFLLFLKMALALLRIRRSSETRQAEPRLFWLKDKSLKDSENLLEPDVLAQEIAEDLKAALDQFVSIAVELKR